mmetsp:Transcript_132864/g.301771  ORF Transcript_132864/g.301771 Transcript_132864/m.301771 type:complete len:207 (+) Transcript_132864:454-1074(+)
MVPSSSSVSRATCCTSIPSFWINRPTTCCRVSGTACLKNTRGLLSLHFLLVLTSASLTASPPSSFIFTFKVLITSRGTPRIPCKSRASMATLLRVGPDNFSSCSSVLAGPQRPPKKPQTVPATRLWTACSACCVPSPALSSRCVELAKRALPTDLLTRICSSSIVASRRRRSAAGKTLVSPKNCSTNSTRDFPSTTSPPSTAETSR